MIYLIETVRKSILCASEQTKVICISIFHSCQDSRFSGDKQSFLLTLNMRAIGCHTSGLKFKLSHSKVGLKCRKKFKTTSSSFNNLILVLIDCLYAVSFFFFLILDALGSSQPLEHGIFAK